MAACSTWVSAQYHRGFKAVLWIWIHDPDPAFQVNPDRDTDPVSDPGFNDQKLKKKNTAENKKKKSFLIKNCNLLIKFSNLFLFYGSFLPSWIRIQGPH